MLSAAVDSRLRDLIEREEQVFLDRSPHAAKLAQRAAASLAGGVGSAAAVVAAAPAVSPPGAASPPHAVARRTMGKARSPRRASQPRVRRVWVRIVTYLP